MDFLDDHGLLLWHATCRTCKTQVELNINSLLFTCGKKYRKNKTIKKCSFKKSAKKGTFFEQSKLPLEKIVYFVVLWLRIGFPRQRFVMRELQCNSHTVVDWSSFCREVCIQWVLNNSEKIGVGKIVEIDEAKFGKRKYNRGRRIEGKWVFGGIERDTKKVFLVPVENRTSETLLTVIKQWIHPGTIIVSDCWKSYDVLQSEGFIHLRINHSLQFVDPDDAMIHTQNIERTWRDVCGAIPRYGRKELYFIGYLAEFLFKRQFYFTDVHNFFIETSKLYPPQ